MFKLSIELVVTPTLAMMAEDIHGMDIFLAAKNII
jgi:hypothetical protein